jgi:hypothetical protein
MPLAKASHHQLPDVDSIRRSGRTVEIEATETSTGESTTLEMDDN